jgi:hypothetical protein
LTPSGAEIFAIAAVLSRLPGGGVRLRTNKKASQVVARPQAAKMVTARRAAASSKIAARRGTQKAAVRVVRGGGVI